SAAVQLLSLSHRIADRPVDLLRYPSVIHHSDSTRVTRLSFTKKRSRGWIVVWNRQQPDSMTGVSVQECHHLHRRLLGEDLLASELKSIPPLHHRLPLPYCHRLRLGELDLSRLKIEVALSVARCPRQQRRKQPGLGRRIDRHTKLWEQACR